MVMSAVAPKRCTAEAYLEFEVNSDRRHEFIDGEIVPMSGGTPNHNEIAGNLYIAVKTKLKGQDYRTFYVDQRLWLPIPDMYTYPDVMVVPKPLEFQPRRTDTIVNPILIAEVLSKSTKAYDRDEKFAAYRTIPAFREYLLIDQYSFHVEQYTKTPENRWLFSEHNGLEASFHLESIDCTVTLAELYNDIELTIPEAPELS